jgi:nucleoside-diphosphate-sugar epimerase
MHISDAVRAVEAAGRVKEYAVINVGHPDVRSVAELAELIRTELGASADLVVKRELPSRMTLHKRPRLDRQRGVLGVEPVVSLEEGVQRVCATIVERLAGQTSPTP